MKIEVPNKKFEMMDLILPTLDLPDPCSIKIEIRDDSVFLYIGARDWQWDFGDERLVGCGTTVSPQGDKADE
ncbi:hypothetical protein LCGC14_0252070 [marine sediment metagenome]|uniref:Uncharacterized protein n=1 Tax=marine sediment metagenome TaxID=412755 RepID=A0A0F9U4H3_9ZZZZ